jgi:polysaccharide deacetylase 2 family uncharacterized protein YibQ
MSAHRSFQNHDARTSGISVPDNSDENARLKKIVADLALDKEMLHDVIKRKLETRKNWSGFAPPVMIGPSPAS